jgi:hypothetical protein
MQTSTLIYFSGEIEFNIFIDDLKKCNKKHIINHNPNFDFLEENGKLCICNISKEDKPNWFSTCIIKKPSLEKIKNTHTYRIVIYKFTDLIIYVEINGGIQIFDATIDKYNSEIFNLPKNITIDILNDKINNFLCKDELLFDNINEICIEKFNEPFDIIINPNEYSMDIFLQKYNDLIENKKIDDANKLPKYIRGNCLDKNNKSSETAYNKFVCDSNLEKYVNLDRHVIDGCEISDIFDKQNNLLFHNKKNNDLRVLACQIFIGALILKNRSEKCINFIEKYNIDVNNFKYVFGLIQTNKKIALKDKLSIGNTCFILNKLDIEYYVDIIEYEN